MRRGSMGWSDRDGQSQDSWKLTSNWTPGPLCTQWLCKLTQTRLWTLLVLQSGK